MTVKTRPRAAVIIPTHNRVALLPRVLDSVLAQSVEAEIYVMDDASTDETEAIVRRDYPGVFYRREETSKGPTFQRNKAAALTEAEILFTIDDDCVLKSPRTLEQTLAAFDNPRVGGVTLPWANVLTDGIVRHSAPDQAGVWLCFDYLGGMVALRRDVFLGVGGYRPYLYIQVEEQDLSIRMLQAGYVVRLGSADPLDHLESALRDNPRRHRQGPRNYVLYAFYNVPWPYFPIHLLGATMLCMKLGVSIGHPIYAVEGLCQGYWGMMHEFGRRSPVPGNIYRLARMMKRRGQVALSAVEGLLPPLKPAEAAIKG